MNLGRLHHGGRGRKPSARPRGVHASNPGLSTTVGGLAKAAGVTTHVVRYYTRIGLLTPERDATNNYKRFNNRHLARLRFIRGAQALGYTLAEIHRIFGHAANGRSPCPEVRDILRRRVVETREQLRDLRELQQRMERALRTWQKMKDGMPDGHSVCVLIESALSGTEYEVGEVPGHDRASKHTKAARRKKK